MTSCLERAEGRGRREEEERKNGEKVSEGGERKEEAQEKLSSCEGWPLCSDPKAHLSNIVLDECDLFLQTFDLALC